MGEPGRNPWTDRILGAAIGAAVTTVVLWPDDDPSAPSPATDTTVTQSEPPPASEPATDELTPPDLPPTPAPPAAEPTVVDTTDAGPAEGSTGEAPTDHGDAPEIPINRLPGSKILRRSSRFDEEKDAWVLIETVRVVAPATQVQGYYEKALEDLGIRVRSVDEPPNDKFKHRSTIRGRARGIVIQISVRQEAAQMRTTARLIWRVDPDRVTG